MIGDVLMEGLRAVGAPAIAALLTWVGLRQSGRHKKIDAAQSLFNEVQEERGELKKDNAKLLERIERMEEANRARDERDRARDERERIRDDYIQVLRNDIRLGIGPPPRDWPEGLRHG